MTNRMQTAAVYTLIAVVLLAAVFSVVAEIARDITWIKWAFQ